MRTVLILSMLLILAACGGGGDMDENGRVVAGTPNCTKGACK